MASGNAVAILRDQMTYRRLRLAAGLVMFTYLALHLTMHSLGNLSFDAMLAWQTEELLKREVARDDWIVHVRPELVVEITFNDLQASPRYPGGLALRFARVKGYRPDKKAQDADTIDTVRAIYGAQERRV